jgi:sulfonate transport system ATP-binding protein
MAHALHIAGLVKCYGAKPVLGPIALDLARGTITAIIGRSGCGKTTLLRCLGGLERPSAGTIRIGAGNLNPEDIGYVFQEPRLMPWLTVSGNVAFGLGHRADRDAAIEEALQTVGLRVALARALAPAPELLLLDEPFSALDPFTREQMQDHLLYLHRHYRTTMVLITHDMDEALALADRIIVLHGPPGRVTGDLAPGLARRCARSSPEFMAWKSELAGRLFPERHVREERQAVLF